MLNISNAGFSFFGSHSFMLPTDNRGSQCRFVDVIIRKERKEIKALLKPEKIISI